MLIPQMRSAIAKETGRDASFLTDEYLWGLLQQNGERLEGAMSQHRQL